MQSPHYVSTELGWWSSFSCLRTACCSSSALTFRTFPKNQQFVRRCHPCAQPCFGACFLWQWHCVQSAGRRKTAWCTMQLSEDATPPRWLEVQKIQTSGGRRSVWIWTRMTAMPRSSVSGVAGVEAWILRTGGTPPMRSQMRFSEVLASEKRVLCSCARSKLASSLWLSFCLEMSATLAKQPNSRLIIAVCFVDHCEFSEKDFMPKNAKSTLPTASKNKVRLCRPSKTMTLLKDNHWLLIYIYIMLYYILYYIILLIPRIQGSIQPSCSLSRSIGHRWPNIHHCADHAHVRPPSGQTGRCFFYLISLRLLILFNLLMWNFIATNLTGAFLAMDWARLRLSDNWQSPRTGNGYLGWWGKIWEKAMHLIQKHVSNVIMIS